MPLMMCPNDNSPMTTVDRSGVQFDMCPSCRGVWLDRGELEKLMESSRVDGQAAAPRPSYPPSAPYRDRDDDRRDHDDHRRYRKRGSIFDIFD